MAEQRKDAPRDPVQSFWLGSISTLERLSITSFLANGHDYDLYAYEDLRGIPNGARLRDAGEILPATTVFIDDRGTYATFANLFRYQLLLERGGWWVDTDTVCLRPFDFDDDCVLGLEPDQTLASGVIRVPPGSELMCRAVEEALQVKKRPMPWGVIGPALLDRLAKELGYLCFARESSVFYPIDWPAWESILDPKCDWDLESGAHAVHLWNSLWALHERDKDASYPSRCLYERLKRRYPPSQE